MFKLLWPNYKWRFEKDVTDMLLENTKKALEAISESNPDLYNSLVAEDYYKKYL